MSKVLYSPLDDIDECLLVQIVQKNVALVFGVWLPGARIPQVSLRLKKKDGRLAEMCHHYDDHHHSHHYDDHHHRDHG